MVHWSLVLGAFLAGGVFGVVLTGLAVASSRSDGDKR